MIEKIRAIYNRALLRPMIYMATNRFLIALILLLLANLLLSGAHIKMYAALLLGVCFVLLAWIAWAAPGRRAPAQADDEACEHPQKARAQLWRYDRLH